MISDVLKIKQCLTYAGRVCHSCTDLARITHYETPDHSYNLMKDMLSDALLSLSLKRLKEIHTNAHVHVYIHTQTH